MRSATTNTKKRFPQKALAAAITTIILGASTTAMAFKPAVKNHGHTFITSSILGHSTGGTSDKAFLYHGHPASGSIVFKTNFSDGSPVTFSEEASIAITIGNESTDYMTSGSKLPFDFFDYWLLPVSNYWQTEEGTKISLLGEDGKAESGNPSAHCDDELIAECSERILKLRDEAIDQLYYFAQNKIAGDTNAADFELPQTIAWIKLGKALHTLQDFYAHSNFADINTSEDAYFTLLTSGGLKQNKDSLAKETNGNAVIRSESVCQWRLGFIDPLITDVFFKSGGNWELKEAGLRSFTTGYFNTFGTLTGLWATGSDNAFGAAKCDHGLDVTLGITGLSGIAKDDPYAPLKDHKPIRSKITDVHIRATVQAAHHSKVFLDEVVSKIKSTYPDPNVQDNMIAALLGQVVPSKKPPTEEETKGNKPVYGFVIDVTGSMSDVIEGIKQGIQTKIDELAGKASADQQFMLITYNDNHYGDPSAYAGVSDAIFGKADFIKQKIGELRVGGGGDCAENTLRASAKAAVSAPIGSTLLVYTDASANDEDFFGQLTGITNKKKIALSFGVSGTCNPDAYSAKSARSATASTQSSTIHFQAKPKSKSTAGFKAAAPTFTYKVDDIYLNLAKATGGQVIQTEHNAESAAAALTGIDLSVALGDLKTIKSEEGKISAVKTVDFILDDQATVMNVVATLDNGDITFTSPTGVVVAGEKLKLFDFLGGQSLKAIDPTIGVWKVTFSPSTTNANYSLKAEANARTELKSVKFTGAEEIGRSGHTHYPDFGLAPHVGKNRIELEIANVTTTGLTIKAVDDSGVVIGQSTLSNIGGAFYEAQLTLPETSFRLVVEGKNNAATPLAFERTFSTPITTDALITSRLWSDPMLAGRKNKVIYRVTNLGEKDTYTITAASDTGHVSNLSESSITLEKNQTKDVSFNVEFSSAESTGKDSLITTVDVKGTKNQDSERLIVDIVKDSDGDGVPDSTEMGQVGSNDQYDGNGDGTPDWKQNTVASLYSATLNTYVNIVAKGGGYFTSVKAQPAQATGDVVLPMDAFEIKLNVKDVESAKADVEFILPDFVQAKDFFYRPSVTGDWTAFTLNAGIGLKQAQDNTITVTVADGLTGDVDNTKNGEILFYGAPAKVGFKGVKSADTSTSASNSIPAWQKALGTLTASENKSKGGGCTVGGVGFSDASLPLLLLGGLMMRITTRRKKQV
ncbi:MAG: hypothetical protein KDI39_06420 [Pseudomonadales bacterium]|nr:hypothetical protein [Pseudomonadales bacterium]